METTAAKDRFRRAWSVPGYSLSELRQELKYSLTSVPGIQDFNNPDTEKLLCVVGPGGIGKTALCLQVAEELKMELCRTNVGGSLAEDFHGKLMDDTDGKTAVTGRRPSKMAPPFYREPQSESGCGVWLLDEVFSGQTSEHQAFVRMLASGQLDELKMRKGWYIVGTSNPPDADHFLVQEVETTVADRFVFFPVKVDPETYFRYWEGRMSSSLYPFLVTEYFANKGTVFSAVSPRVWMSIDTELGKRERLGAPRSSLIKCLQVQAGTQASTLFNLFLETGTKPENLPFRRAALTSSTPHFNSSLKVVEKWVDDRNTPLVSTVAWALESYGLETKIRLDSDRGVSAGTPDEEVISRMGKLLICLGVRGYADLVDRVLRALALAPVAGPLVTYVSKSALKDVLSTLRSAQ